ncbi:MAG: AsmA family protein, partial [Gallionella sp.]|nr:AsmA family protein [Gallionella sp.]
MTRITIIVSAVTAVLCAVIIIALRYWLLPDIEQFHGKITASLASAMGNPVSIGKIEGDWLGLHPHLRLSDVRILDKQQQSALVLPRIDATVSWLSLLAAELRLSSLEIDRPELLIRRDQQGEMYVGSVALATQGPGNDLSNWLRHQSRIVVRNAT